MYCKNVLSRVLLVTFSLGLFFSGLLSASAQNVFGAVVGAITDPSGAAVPGASVRLTNNDTNQSRIIKTDAGGSYRFEQLSPGSYRVDISAPGFRSFWRSPIPVQVDSTIRVDTQLQVGAASETVQVTTAPPLLETASGTLGTEVDEKQIQAMPLNGRNPMNLIALDPGVVAQGSTTGAAGLNTLGTGHTNIPGWGNYAIGGAIAGEAAEYLDGAPMNGYSNLLTLVPVQDVIQEFKISTNAVAAEFGRFGGGVVEMSTKSGGNQIHGSIYEYFRNNVLNANDFFSNHAGRKRPEWNQNQFGAIVSGPIKKDKAFFLGSWEGFKARLGIPTTEGTPSYDMEQGIFLGKTITDPTGNCTTIAYYNASGGVTTSKGANGAVAKSVIPTSCFDSTAVITEGYFPAPSASTPTATNYFNAPVVDNTMNQYNARVDYDLGNKQRLFGRYTLWNLSDSSERVYANTAINSGNSYTTNKTQQIVLGDTYTLGPKTILDLRASYLRDSDDGVPPTLNFNPGTLGPGWTALESQTQFKMIPAFTFTGADNLAVTTSTSSPVQTTFEDYVLGGSVLKIVGSHTFQFGGEGRMLQRYGFAGGSTQAGSFTWNQSTTGDEFASMLLGEAYSSAVETVLRVATINVPEGYYAMDTWQATRKLTVDVGLRWELPGAITEKHNRAAVVLPNTTDPVTGLKGAAVLVGTSLYPSDSIMPVRKDLFAPRLGLAYSLTPKDVIRAGYALAYLPPDLPPGANLATNPVNSATTTLSTPTYHGLQNPFGVLTGTKILQSPGRSNPNFITAFKNQTFAVPVPTTNFPYMHQWNLSLSHAFTGNSMVQVGYAGSMGIHLPSEGYGTSTTTTGYTGIDELAPQYYTGLQNMLNSGSTNAQVEAVGLPERPYPYFKNLVDTAAYIGHVKYNALEITGQKRFSNGGLINVVYAWAKTLGDTDDLTPNNENKAGISTGSGGVSQDFYNPRGDYSLLSYSVPQRMVITYSMPLPFGKGQKWGSGVTGVADKLASGWSVNGITTFQGGFPMGISESAGNLMTTQFGAGVLRPNVTAGCNRKISGSPYARFLSGQWFNATCFTNPTTPTTGTVPNEFSFGNEARNDGEIRAQGVDNSDFAIEKATSASERLNVIFRAEVFNLFNHVQFAPPGEGIGGSDFNQVVVQANTQRLVQLSLRLNF